MYVCSWIVVSSAALCILDQKHYRSMLHDGFRITTFRNDFSKEIDFYGMNSNRQNCT